MPGEYSRDTTVDFGVSTTEPGPSIFIPKAIFKPYVKITITTSDGILYTIRDDYAAAFNDCIDCEVRLQDTTAINGFTLRINNYQGKYTNLFTGGETVRIYADYADGSTLLCKGQIDKPTYSCSSSGFTITIEGRSNPILADEKITKTYEDMSFYAICVGTTGLTDSDGNYEDGLLYNTGIKWSTQNTIGTGDRNTISYDATDRITILADLAQKTLNNFSWYITPDDDLRVFTDRSITNTEEYIAYGENMIELSEYGTDTREIKNKITVYGSAENSIILTRTKNLGIGGLWTKNDIISDSSLNSVSLVNERCDLELATNGEKPVGSISSIGLQTIQSGQLLKIFVPFCNLDGDYKVTNITHSLSLGWTTSCNIDNIYINFAKFLRRQAEKLEQSNDCNNKNDMAETVMLITFDTDEFITHAGTKTENGFLINAGVCTTLKFMSEGTYNLAELRVEGSTISADTYQVSNDNGTTWTSIVPGQLTSLATAGNQWKVKITNTASSQIDTMGLLVK